MNRRQLEHILRASAAITGRQEFVIIGSQAILGHDPAPPDELAASMEADIFPLNSDHDAILIDGSIGEGSPFHQAFGYYAHGVRSQTAVLPEGWRDRLVSIQSHETGGAVGLCLDLHDLAVAKLAAGRAKDHHFVAALVRHRFVTASTIHARLKCTVMPIAQRERCEAELRKLTSAASPPEA